MMISRRRVTAQFARLALVLVPLLLVLVCVEVVLRTTHVFGAKVSWSTPDPTLVYRFAASSKYWHHKENAHPITGRINRFGWRDREWQVEPAPGIQRVAVLGDSYVEAFQVESDSTFLRLGETMLRQRHGIQAELMNFGRSGFTQTEQLILLRDEVLRFSPDVVVVCFLPGNDIADVRRETSPDPVRPYFVEGSDNGLRLDTSFRHGRGFRLKKALDPIKRRSALLSLVFERYRILRARGADVPAPEAGAAKQALPPYLSLATANPDPRYETSYAFCKRLIAELARVCAANETIMVLMCLDSPGYSPEAESQLRGIDATFDPLFFEKDLGRLAGQLGIGFVGLQTPFQRASARGRTLHWVHWNYEGHHLVAEVLSRALGDILAGDSGR